jgi:serine/threonine protein kinase
MPANLHQLIKSSRLLDESCIQLFVYQILRGLKYIHSAGVIHRDLKPTNLLVTETCDLKICDFGCGRSATTSNRNALKMTLLEHVATRWYRAPEGLLSSEDYNSKVDIWSVGCIMAELFQRQVLFPGKTNTEQIAKIIDIMGKPSDEELERIPNPFREKIRSMPVTQGCKFQELFPHASPQALDLLEQMLQFDPTKRISVNEALAHPFLARWHREDDEPVAERLFNEDLNNNLALENYRDLIYNEIVDLRCKTSVGAAYSLTPQPCPQPSPIPTTTSATQPDEKKLNSSNPHRNISTLDSHNHNNHNNNNSSAVTPTMSSLSLISPSLSSSSPLSSSPLSTSPSTSFALASFVSTSPSTSTSTFTSTSTSTSMSASTSTSMSFSEAEHLEQAMLLALEAVQP